MEPSTADEVAEPEAAPRWTGARATARGIDLSISIALLFVPGLGLLVASAFTLLADAIPGGSPGKRLLGLHCERRRPDRPWEGPQAPAPWLPVRPIDSVLRNAPVAAPLLLVQLLGFLGWLGALIGVVLLLAVLLLEFSLVAQNEGGARVGDILADTRVTGLPPPTFTDRVTWDPDLDRPNP